MLTLHGSKLKSASHCPTTVRLIPLPPLEISAHLTSLSKATSKAVVVVTWQCCPWKPHCTYTKNGRREQVTSPEKRTTSTTFNHHSTGQTCRITPNIGQKRNLDKMYFKTALFVTWLSCGKWRKVCKQLEVCRAQSVSERVLRSKGGQPGGNGG